MSISGSINPFPFFRYEASDGVDEGVENPTGGYWSDSYDHIEFGTGAWRRHWNPLTSVSENTSREFPNTFSTGMIPETPVAKAEQHRIPSRSPAIYEPALMAKLKGVTVSVFPDTGAAANFISLEYVRSRGIRFERNTTRRAKTAAGSSIDLMGTVMLSFSFDGEKKSYRLEFNVMRYAFHDIVMGSPFLNMTETFTRHIHRIKERLRATPWPRLCLLGSQQYVRGGLNGIDVNAIPDTGADLSVMSASFAKKNGFAIDTAKRHQKLLVFADKSTAMTSGLVEGLEWKFRSSNVTHHLDVYVLEDLETDLILHYTFLTELNAFIEYEEDFWVDDHADHGFGFRWLISIIKLVDKTFKRSRWKQSATSSGQVEDDADTSWKDEKQDKLNAYRLARQQARSMAVDQRKAFLEPHLAQGKRFLESRPSRASASQSSISPVSSSPSTPVGALISSTPSGQSTFLDRLRRLKQKALPSALSRPETS